MSKARLSPERSNRQIRKAMGRVVSRRQYLLEAFVKVVAQEHYHRFKRRALKCLICQSLRDLHEEASVGQ